MHFRVAVRLQEQAIALANLSTGHQAFLLDPSPLAIVLSPPDGSEIPDFVAMDPLFFPARFSFLDLESVLPFATVPGSADADLFCDGAPVVVVGLEIYLFSRNR